MTATSTTTLTSRWRIIAAAALVLAAVVWLVFLATAVSWLQAVTFGALAVALVVVALGHPSRPRSVGKIGLLLLVAGAVVFVAAFLVGDLFGTGWTPVIIFGLTLYALFGLGIILIIVDLVIALLAVARKTEPVSFVPAIFGATLFVSTMSVYLPYPDWLAYLLPVACVASAAYLPVAPKR